MKTNQENLNKWATEVAMQEYGSAQLYQQVIESLAAIRGRAQ